MTMILTLRRLVLVLLLSGAAVEAHAANVYLEQARQKYQELDYQALPALLAEAVLQPETTREEYLEIYKLQGFTYTVLGDSQKAREAFIRLLIVDPNHEMDASVSPRFRGVFAEVKKDFRKNSAVSLEHTPPVDTLQTGQDLEVQVSLKDTFGRAAQAAAKVRAVVGGQQGAFVNVPLQSAGTKEGVRVYKGKLPDPAASIPGEKPAGYFIEYSFVFQNMVGDPVEVQGGKPIYRVTVGDPSAAATTRPPSGSKAEEDEGGPPIVPLAVVGGVGVAAVLVVGLLVVGGGTGAAVGGGAAAYCYLVDETRCGTQTPNRIGRVNVVVER
ncbi:MAG: hypothetical protein AB2A00_26345 [Myxococcota bacterium]